MQIAVWIIAICEIIRTLQVTADIIITMNSRKTINNAFVDSLKKDNREWAEDLLKDFLEKKDKEVEK